jgi:hypothetical protein
MPAASFDANVKIILDTRDAINQVKTLVDDIATMTNMPIEEVESMAKSLGWYKQKSSGGLKDAAVAGGVAGVAAGLTIKLIDAIDSWVKQSKIVGVFFDTVGKAMALLIDLILLPFLPIIIWVMITLFQSVMIFGRLWGETMKLYIQPLIDAIKAWKLKVDLALPKMEDLPIVAWAGILLGALIVGMTTLIATGGAAAILTGIVTAVFTALGVIVASPVILAILTGIATAILMYLGWQLGLKIAEWFKPIWDEWSPKVRKFFADVGTDLSNWETNWNNHVKTTLEGFGKYWTDNVSGPLWNSLTELETALEGVRDAIGNFINNVILIFKQVWWGVLDTLHRNTWVGWAVPDPGNYPSAQSGGRVARTGLAIIHKGEDIVPGGQGITVNIYGTYQNDEDLYKKFVDKIRRDQWRYNI